MDGLKRVIGFWAFVIYGVGDILGAGIYALIGKVASLAGGMTWAAFLCAFTGAAFTALSYAELGSRYPKTGGESTYLGKAFGVPFITFMTGWFVLMTSLVSMATVSHAFSGYVGAIFPGIPHFVLAFLFLATLGLINFFGIQLSSGVNIVLTFMEVSGLIFVIGLLFYFLGTHPAEIPYDPPSFQPIFQAGTLAFFAFIGFEDMVKLAEEMKSPKDHLAKGILSALLIAGAIYMTIAYLVPLVIPKEILGTSNAPLLEVVKLVTPSFPLAVFSLIAVAAVSNTALLNFVSGSRLIYGMAEETKLPKFLRKLHVTTKTPHWAILIMFLMVIPLALLENMETLAGTTTSLLLAVFFLLNLALIRIKLTKPEFQGMKVPMIVPILGIVTTFFLLSFTSSASLVTALMITSGGVAIFLFCARRP